MAQPARPPLSFDEYLRIEGDSLVKHEHRDGVVWAMGGGTDEHAALAANVIRLLGNQLLGKPCRVYTSDLRVRVRSGERAGVRGRSPEAPNCRLGSRHPCSSCSR